MLQHFAILSVTVAALYMYYLVAVLINLYVVDVIFCCCCCCCIVVVVSQKVATSFPPQKNRCNPAEMGQISFDVVTF